MADGKTKSQDRVKPLWLTFTSHGDESLNSHKTASISFPCILWNRTSHDSHSDPCLFLEAVCSLCQAGSFHSSKLSLITLTVHLAVHVLMGLLHILWFFCIAHFGRLYFLMDLAYFSPRHNHKVGVVHLDPLWPVFLSRVYRWTVFILIAPDKRFPWHSISPSSHFLSFSSTCLSILTTGFQAFSGLAELMEQGSYRAEQSADCFSGRQNKERGRREAMEGGVDFEDSDKGHVLGLLRDSHYFPFSTEAMMRMKHFLSLKVAICPFNACVMKAWHLFIHPPCTNLNIFFFYSLADNSHFISIKLCLFTAICCCNVLELSA